MTDPNDPMTTLTKREYFAAMAMQGLIISAGVTNHSADACIMADTLIAQLNNEVKS